MGLGDEYDMDGVDAEETEAYRDAVSARAEDMRLADVHGLWREAGMDHHNDRAYAAARGYIEGLDYNADAAYSFCADTPLEGRDGLFLTAVADQAPTDTVRLPDLADVDDVGYKTGATLHIEGDVGDRCGSRLMGGAIHVEGDAGSETGTFMRHGSITVDGGTAAYCGQGMRDGSITIHGSAVGEDDVVVPGESYLGEWRGGGEITVHGDTGDRVGQRITGGRITIRGDTGSHAGYAMTDGTITVAGRAGSDLGHSMRDGTVTVGRTTDPVGTEMRGGTIHVRERVDGAWPPIGPDAHGDIIYGDGAEEERVWLPDPRLGDAEPRGVD